MSNDMILWIGSISSVDQASPIVSVTPIYEQCPTSILATFSLCPCLSIPGPLHTSSRSSSSHHFKILVPKIPPARQDEIVYTWDDTYSSTEKIEVVGDRPAQTSESRSRVHDCPPTSSYKPGVPPPGRRSSCFGFRTARPPAPPRKAVLPGIMFAELTIAMKT